MKKSKLLIGVVALSVALMGIGYAWWTEAVVATGTVNTAKMDVVVTSAELSKVDSEDNDKYLEFTDPEIDETNGSEAFTFVVSKMYPHSTAKLDITVKNTGSIGVKVNDVQITADNGDLIKQLRFSVDNQAFVTLAELKGEIATKGIGAAEITPAGATQTKSFSIYIRFPEGTDAVDASLEDITDESQQFGFTVNFAQFNNAKPAPTTPIAPPAA